MTDLPARWWEYALAAIAYAGAWIVLGLTPVWPLAVVPALLALFNAKWAWQKARLEVPDHD